MFQHVPFIDEQYSDLGASLGRIQVFKCCVKILLEVKSILSEGNLQPHVAATHCLNEVAVKHYVKKKETSWNYQMLGKMNKGGKFSKEIVVLRRWESITG